MDEREFDHACRDREKMYCTALAVLDNSAEWIEWYYRSLDLEGEQQTSLKALMRKPDLQTGEAK